jgi:hypothetical protein
LARLVAVSIRRSSAIASGALARLVAVSAAAWSAFAGRPFGVTRVIVEIGEDQLIVVILFRENVSAWELLRDKTRLVLRCFRRLFGGFRFLPRNVRFAFIGRGGRQPRDPLLVGELP